MDRRIFSSTLPPFSNREIVWGSVQVRDAAFGASAVSVRRGLGSLDADLQAKLGSLRLLAASSVRRSA